MKRKFECWDCHKTFDADDKVWVECPHCHSDNVEYWAINYLKYIKVAGGVVCLGAIALGFYTAMSNSNALDSSSGNDVIIVKDEFSDISAQDTGLVALPPMEGQLPILSLKGAPEFTGTGYNFSVNIEFAPEENYKYVILDAFENNVVAESKDGIFSNIPYSTAEGGSYRIKVVSEDGTRDLNEPKPIVGFIKQVVTTKMPAQELQQLLDYGDDSILGVGENEHIAPNYKIEYSNLPKDVMNIPKTLGELYADKLMTAQWEVKITSVQYDDMNRISVIKCQVTDNSIDF